jgi:hypothetical protein
LAALEGARLLAANAAPRPEDRAHPTAHLVADALDSINRDSADATRIVFPTYPSISAGMARTIVESTIM